MKQINLLPKTEQNEFRMQFFSRRLIVFWIWIIASLVVFFLLAFAAQIYLQKSIDDAESQITANQALLNSSDFRSLQDQIVALNKNIKEINNLEGQHYEWSGALVQIADLIPSNVQLNNLNLAGSTGQIDITGQSKTRDSVIGIWSQVIKSDYFKNINFPLANLEKADNANFTYTFFANKDKFKAP